MRHRLILLTSALGLALGGATLPLTAAHAATGTFATVDGTTDGEVTGTFTSDAGRARVTLLRADGSVADYAGYTPSAGEPVAFHLTALTTEAGSDATVTLTVCDVDWSNCAVADERSVTLADAGPVTVTAAAADASPIVAADHPESSIRVTLGNTEDRVGHLRMYLTWLDASGWPIADFPDTSVELPQPAATYDVRFSPRVMSSGVHRLRLTVRGPRPATVTTQELEVEVVNPAPKIASFTRSSSTVYPAKDGYRDTVRFTMKPAAFDPADEVTLQIEDALVGGIVRTLEPVSATAAGGYVFAWDGRHDNGSTLWAGPFRAVVTLRDTVAHVPEVSAVQTVDVIRQHLEPRVWSTIVTAGATLDHASVGGCSTLRKPSLSGWSGSLGLYSNTRCRSTSGASVVRTFHDLVVPRAPVHDFLRVDTYGGSPRGASTDAVTVRYRSTGGAWVEGRTYGPTVGWRTGVRVPASTVLSSDHTVRWDAHVSSSDRWDLGRFRIVLGYRALVND